MDSAFGKRHAILHKKTFLNRKSFTHNNYLTKTFFNKYF